MNRSACRLSHHQLFKSVGFFGVQTGLHGAQTTSLRSQRLGKIEWAIIKTMKRPGVLLAFVGASFLAWAAGNVNRAIVFLFSTASHNYGVYIYIYIYIYITSFYGNKLLSDSLSAIQAAGRWNGACATRLTLRGGKISKIAELPISAMPLNCHRFDICILRSPRANKRGRSRSMQGFIC